MAAAGYRVRERARQADKQFKERFKRSQVWFWEKTICPVLLPEDHSYLLLS
jgi:hypothetical protein